MESTSSRPGFHKTLRNKYLFVYLSASFADWLQGPYLYRLYSSYGYEKNQISLLYVTGSASGAVSGLIVGHLADAFGRKRLCVFYSLVTSVSCFLTTASRSYFLLSIARILSGASTCILLSVFESWYVGQHLSRYHLDEESIAEALTKSTLYNGLLAIIAGISSSYLADSSASGPAAPFLLAVPVALFSGFSCSILWEESTRLNTEDYGFMTNVSKSLEHLFFSRKKSLLLLLGATQSLFETVVYIFVFMWTPVLEPLRISHGFVFGGFMLCVMMGSALYSHLSRSFGVSRENLLCFAVLLAFLSIFGSTLGVYAQRADSGRIPGGYLALASFMLFEISVGMYYPAIGYLRGLVLPESHRASIANWFRLPANLLVCLSLLYVGFEKPSNCAIFTSCALALLLALVSSFNFAKLFSKDSGFRSVGKVSESFVL